MTALSIAALVALVVGLAAVGVAYRSDVNSEFKWLPFIAWFCVAASAIVLVAESSSWTTRGVTVLDIVTGSAIAGVAAMIVLELFKRLIPIRPWLTHRRVDQWIERRLPSNKIIVQPEFVNPDLNPEVPDFYISSVRPDDPIARAPEPIDRQEVSPGFARFATITVLDVKLGTLLETPTATWADQSVAAVRRRQFLQRQETWAGAMNLPTPQLVAQIAGVVDTLPASTELIVIPVDPNVYTIGDDGGLSRSFRWRSEHVESLAKGLLAQVFQVSEDPRTASRALDHLQTYLSGHWRRTIQLAACVIAGLLAAVASLVNIEPYSHSVWVVVACFFFGGFTAWLSRDVVAVIERLRH